MMPIPIGNPGSARRARPVRVFRFIILMIMMIMTGLSVPSPAQTVAPSGSSSEPETVELSPVVVTGTSLPDEASRSVVSATVITREEIEARGETGVTELLRDVPGLHMDQAGGRGSVSSAYLRGGDPNHTVVLLDGIRLNDPMNSRGGSYDFSGLNADSIERVEIVPGAASSLYGSDALSGVIQIFTARGTDEPVTRVKASGGRFGYFGTGVETGGRRGPTDYFLSGSYTDNGESVEGSLFIGKDLHAHLGREGSGGGEIRWVVHYSDDRLESFPDDSGGPELAVIREVDERDVDEFSTGLEIARPITSRWEVRIRAGYYGRGETVESPGVAPGIRDPFGLPPSRTENLFRRHHLILHTPVRIGEGLDLTAGIELQSETGESRGELTVGGLPVPTRFDLRRNLWASLIELRYRVGERFTFQAGLRRDESEGFGAEESPRIGLSYRFSRFGTRLHANWGEGFKLPSFFALSHPIVGNPDLVPEKGKTAEVGLTQPIAGDRVRLSAVFFSNRFEDAIDFEEGPPPRLVNRSEITARGSDWSVVVRAGPDLDLSAYLSYVRTDIRGTDEELRNRPERRGGVSALWRPCPGWGWSLEALYVGTVLDSSIPTGDVRLDDYVRLDLAVTWKPNGSWRAFAAVDNLLNAEYEEAVGFPAPGVTPRIGLEAVW